VTSRTGTHSPLAAHRDAGEQPRRTLDDYYDIEAAERDRFLKLDGVGPTTATRLVEQFDFVERAADLLLGAPHASPAGITSRRTDEIRDALEDAGFTPPCDCDTYTDVQHAQTREDVLAHCRACDGVIQA
jgi:hypothetical protein